MVVQKVGPFEFTASYIFSHDELNPKTVLSDIHWMYRWRWAGHPLLIPFIAFARTHDKFVSKALAKIHKQLTRIEDELSRLSQTNNSEMDLRGITRSLHLFNLEHDYTARRAHFQKSLVSAITETLRTFDGYEIEEYFMKPLRTSVETRQYGFDTLPKREQTARQTVGPNPCTSLAIMIANGSRFSIWLFLEIR